MSYSLNSLKGGGYLGDFSGECLMGLILEDTGNLDYSSDGGSLKISIAA